MFTGFAGLVELSQSPGWDPRAGATILRRWRGLPGAIRLAATELRALGVRHQIEPQAEGSYEVLLATFGEEEGRSVDEPLSDRWVLVGNDLEKDLWDCPKISFELAKVTDQSKIHISGRLKKLIDSILSGDDEVSDPRDPTKTVSPSIQTLIDACTFLGISSAPFLQYVKDRLQGVESYTVSQWVLRRETVVSVRCRIRPGLANVGCVFTTAQLLSVEKVPVQLRFDLAPGYWAKRTPTFTQTGADKWTVEQEYWHSDRYSPLAYDPAQ